jgi:hypothetical protein
VAGRFELELTPTLNLRSGVNGVRVVAANGEAAAESEFRVTYVPPAVRVVIDEISEPGPGGKGIGLKPPEAGKPVEAAGYLLNVRGRVVWDNDDDPVARNPNLRVVFVANHVAHPGVEPKMPVGGKREREFAGPVYIHARQSTVKVELRSGPQPGAMPQQGSGEFEFAENCAKPLDKQRLHVLVIGVDVPERERVELARKVVAALDGKIPGDNPNFDSGVLAFEHPEFTRAMVYPPRIGYAVNKSAIDGLLMDVEKMIAQTRKQPGQDWVNDVVLVYYQGRSNTDKDGHWRVHTSMSLLASPSVAEREAVALEYLYPTPGLRVPVLNNIDEPGRLRSPLGLSASELILLRYGWKDAGARESLLPILRDTVAARRTVGDVVDGVRSEVTSREGHVGEPIDTLPTDVRPRIIGPRKP